MTLKKILLACLILIIAAFAIWQYKVYKTVPTLPAYENKLTDVDGKTFKISDFKGKYVLISYFKTWCGDCIKELPSIDNLQVIVGPEKLVVLMVNDEGLEKVERFKNKNPNTLEFFQTNKPFDELGIRVFPTTYLLDTNGVIMLSKLEGFNWDNEGVVSLIK